MALSNNYAVVDPTIETIAKNIDRSTIQTWRITKKAQRLGLVKIQRRRVLPERLKEMRAKGIGNNQVGNTSSEYELHPLFNDENVRKQFSKFAPFLKYLPLLLLFSILYTSPESHYESLKRIRYSSFLLYIKTDSYTYTDHVYLQQKNDNSKREFYMSNEPSDLDVFSKSVREAGELFRMTYAGMCTISQFGDMVINAAVIRFKKITNKINKPYPFFFTLCNTVAEEMEINVNKRESFRLAEVLEIKLDNEQPSVYEEGLEPIPAKEKPRQAEKAKTGYHRPYKPAATEKVSDAIQGSFSIDQLRLSNPDMVIERIKYISRNMVKITHHFDTEWRRTTHEERELWEKNMREHCNKLATVFKLPPTPEWFYGDPNFAASRNYHLDDGGVLHLPSTNKGLCEPCGPITVNVPKEEKVPAKETHDPNRTLSNIEEELIQYFRDYYRHMKSILGEVPAWYDNIVKVIKNRQPNLEKYLGLIKMSLEANGWRRDEGGNFEREVPKSLSRDSNTEKPQTNDEEWDGQPTDIDTNPDDFKEVL